MYTISPANGARVIDAFPFPVFQGSAEFPGCKRKSIFPGARMTGKSGGSAPHSRLPSISLSI